MAKILYIEDIQDNITLVEKIVTSRGHEFLFARNAESGLAMAFDSRPDLILLDLRMPRVDGIQILRQLKSDPERKKIPVIVLISSREGKNYLESHQLKADAYIVKPVDFKKFLNAISDIGLTWKILDSPVSSSKI